MKKIIYALGVLIFVLLVNGCEENLIVEEYSNTPTDNYKAFCSEFGKVYGAFEAKHINWDSLTNYYSRNINNTTTDKQLFVTLCSLLDELNDGHANLSSTDFGQYQSCRKRSKSFFTDYSTQSAKYIIKQQDLIRTKYLEDRYASLVTTTGWFFYGTINYKNKKIGYIYIPTFIVDHWSNKYIEDAVTLFNNYDAVVIDVRYNGGGQIETFAYTLNMFSNQKTCYLKTKLRNGAGYNDFTEYFSNYTEPHSNSLKNMPVAVLINSFSASGAELFTLGLKTQKNVFTVGDTTWGAFSQVYAKYLPNGWMFRAGSQVMYKPDGSLYTDSKGRYIEGNGIEPDFYCADKLNSIYNGNDDPLNLALEKILLKLP
jgi:hypothetical protein